MKKKYFLILVLVVQSLLMLAQEAYEGYVLFSRNNSSNTYLLDMDNSVVHSWSSSNGGYSAYLLEDGAILRSAIIWNSNFNGGASAGKVQKTDWDGNVVWSYTYSNSDHHSHHDIEPMPNGNVLLIAWESKTSAEATQAGRDDNHSMWPDHIVEIQPVGSTGGEIVWEWHVWDHLIQDYNPNVDNYGVVEDHPELLDINLGSLGGGPGGGADWLHVNGISYNEELDQIVISSHNLDEIWVIDHSTTTEEAAGHTGGNSGKGGDFLYRWGQPSNYGANGNEYFNVVHCAYWIPSDCEGAGNLMAFNNGDNNHQSTIVEIEPPREEDGSYFIEPGSAWEPYNPFWEYSNGNTFYSNHLGGCQRLPNGNTLIAESTSGYLFEVDTNGTIVWEYDTSYEIPRCLKYGTDYPGLANLFPNGTITGTVQDDMTDEPISDAVITLGSYETTSNAAGTFSLELPEGDYQLTCEHPDYFSYTHPEEITIYIGQNTEVQISMTPLTSSDQNEVQKLSYLTGNYPNPFNPETTISFYTAEPSDTEISIYNIHGQKVRQLVNENLSTGQHSVVWDGKDDAGDEVASGIFFYKMKSGDYVSYKKMIMIK